MHVLVAEDDPHIAAGLVHSLRQAGYAVDRVTNGIEADAALAASSIDLLILDLGLPRLSGLEVLRRLRDRDDRIPVLILTAQDAIQDRVRGLDLGADDYLVKPFALQELAARVRALTRRGPSGAPMLKHGALRFDRVGKVAYLNEHALDLSARELGLLEMLLSRVGRIVSKENLVEHLCGWGEEVSTNAIEVYIHRLRRKLEPAVKIETVRGLGYRIERAAAD
jgi:two-component system OmpR family response regulator